MGYCRFLFGFATGACAMFVANRMIEADAASSSNAPSQNASVENARTRLRPASREEEAILRAEEKIARKINSHSQTGDSAATGEPGLGVDSDSSLPNEDQLEAQLQKYGVSDSKARAMLQNFGPVKINSLLEREKQRVESGGNGMVHTPAEKLAAKMANEPPQGPPREDSQVASAPIEQAPAETADSQQDLQQQAPQQQVPATSALAQPVPMPDQEKAARPENANSTVGAVGERNSETKDEQKTTEETARSGKEELPSQGTRASLADSANSTSSVLPKETKDAASESLPASPALRENSLRKTDGSEEVCTVEKCPTGTSKNVASELLVTPETASAAH